MKCVGFRLSAFKQASFALIGIPVLLAGNCFSKMFAQQKSSGYALGINLIGAMAGGLLEYISMLHGMRSVWMVLAMVYFAAFTVWFVKYHLVNTRIAKQGGTPVQPAPSLNTNVSGTRS